MLGEGLCVTVNSDDPAYFGGYVADNYSAVRDGLGFSREEFRVVAESSFKASFLSDGEKNKLLEELGSYLRDVSANKISSPPLITALPYRPSILYPGAATSSHVLYCP